MAIEKNITIKSYGLSLEKTYHRINDIKIKNKNINFVVEIYASIEAAHSNNRPLELGFYNTTLEDLERFEGDNIIAKLYSYLKTIVPLYMSETTDV